MSFEDDLQYYAERQHDQERRSRLQNLEFHGVPVTTKENTDAVITRICSFIQVDIKETDIVNSHRLNTRYKNQSTQPNIKTERPPPLIIKFSNRRVISQIMKNRRNLKLIPKRLWIPYQHVYSRKFNGLHKRSILSSERKEKRMWLLKHLDIKWEDPSQEK